MSMNPAETPQPFDPFLEQAANLREYLSGLSDHPECHDPNTINAAAKELQVGRQSLLDFRSGDNGALNKSLVIAWGKMIGSDASFIMPDVEPADSFYGRLFSDQDSRNKRYDQYDIIESTRGEFDSNFSCWADMVCTGSINEEGHYSTGFQPRAVDDSAETNKILMDSSERVFQNVLSGSDLHCIVRDVAKYGCEYEQIGIARRDGTLEIVAIKNLDVRRMQILDDATPTKYYGYFDDGATEPSATYPNWKVAMFCNKRSRADTYGSGVAESSLRGAVQVEAMEAGMIIRRLERAAMRYKWIIDTSQCPDPVSRQAEVNRVMSQNRKLHTIDTGGMQHRMRINLPPGTDIGVGRASKDSVADVEPMQGDANLEQIADFEHFHNKYLSGLGAPKHHLGYEQGTMRSVSTELSIVFARKARRMAMHISKGINHFIWLDLILHGYDPRQISYLIIPPTLGTRDELVRSQIMMAHSTVCVNLAKTCSTTGKIPNIAWFMKYVMGFDDQAVQMMGLQTIVSTKDLSTGNDPALSPKESTAMLDNLNKDDDVAAELRLTRHVLQDRLIAKASAKELVENKVFSPADSRPMFDVPNAIRQLGIRFAA